MLDMINTRLIGVGDYQISTEETGVINARFSTSGTTEATIGSGRATGDTSNGFPGDYRVQYWDAAGLVTGDLDLHIASAGDGYRLTWRHRRENVRIPAAIGEVVFEGIGISTGGNSMAIAYWMSDKVSAAYEARPPR
jgi:hypothetical protein